MKSAAIFAAALALSATVMPAESLLPQKLLEIASWQSKQKAIARPI
jgi:hypothetical protein